MEGATSSHENPNLSQNGLHCQAHGHLRVKATPLVQVGQMMNSVRAAPAPLPKLPALMPPPKIGRVVADPPINRRLVAQYANAIGGRKQQFEIACGENPALCMIHEKLMEFDSGLDDFEDILTARDSRDRWEAAETVKMQQVVRDLHNLMNEDWKQRHKETGLFVEAIHQLATKVEQIQCRNDHAHEVIMRELREIRGQYAQMHGAVSDITVLLGQTNTTMRDANETIELMWQTKGIGKGKDKSRQTEESLAV